MSFKDFVLCLLDVGVWYSLENLCYQLKPTYLLLLFFIENQLGAKNVHSHYDNHSPPATLWMGNSYSHFINEETEEALIRQIWNL